MSDLHKLEQAATPGPWRHWLKNTDVSPFSERYRTKALVGHDDDGRDAEAHGLWVATQMHTATENADAELIAAMRNALPYLLDVVDAARIEAPYVIPTSENPGALERALEALDNHLNGKETP